MKRLLSIGLIFVTALAILAGGPALQADYQALSITSIQCTNGLDPDHTPYLMLDGDSGTYWRTSASSPAETGLLINLSAKARILGLKLTFNEANFNRLAVEYNDQGTWRTFTGQSMIKPTVLNQTIDIDLSYDEIQTDTLRLHIYNNNNQYSYLGSISKLEVFGITETLETAIPLDSVETTNSQDWFRVDNLYDGNTNSTWETTPDSGGSASFILNFPSSQINRIKLFKGPSLKGNLALSYWKDSKWVTISDAEKITSLDSGWNSISCNGISTSKIRGVFTSPVSGRLGGISEIEIWGIDPHGQKTFYDSGVTSSSFGSSSGSLSTKISLPQMNQRSQYNLILATSGGVPDLIFNGGDLSLGQPFSQNTAASPASLYKIAVQPQPGHTDEFDSSTLDSAWSWVRENKSNWSLSENSGALTIHTEYGELLYGDKSMKNILLRQAPAGDWTITTKINATFDNSYEQAGLIVYQDDNNYILMEAKYDYGQKFLCWKTTGGQTIGEYFHNATIPNPCYLKITKLNNNYQCFYSADQVVWQLVKLWEGVDFSNIKIGLIASNGFAYSRPAFQHTIQFDWFNLENGFCRPGGAQSLTLGCTQDGSTAALKIEEVKPNGLLTNWTSDGGSGLNDGLLFTPAVATNQVELNFDSNVQLDRMLLFSGVDLDQLQVQAEVSSSWETLSFSRTQANGVCRIDLNKGVTTRRLRFILPDAVSLNEIQCWGSPVTESKAHLQIDLPLENQVLHPYDHTFKIMGRIDQPDAQIMVNGVSATIAGERFSATLCPWQDNPIYTVTISAQNKQNETTIVKRTVFLSSPPLLTLDQTAGEYYVKDASFTVSGIVGSGNLSVTVNDTAMQLKDLKFSQSVSLKEGTNLISVKVSDSKGLCTTQNLTVYRDNQPPQINILSPINNQTSSTASLTVSGTVADINSCTVTINGNAATINGANFSGTVSLTQGSNPITVTARDKMGNQTSVVLNVNYIKSQPVLSVTDPINNQYLKSGQVAVKGTVTDSLPVMVDVNNIQAQITGNTYQANLTLPEGWNTLQVRATNEAGVLTTKSLQVMVDETKPLDFTVSATPSDWANNNRPVLTFATTDKISGIDHYELAVDDGTFTVVSSPYQLPATPDGEHQITVKAIDKAGWETISTTKVYIDTTPPVAVADFKAVPGNDQIKLSWTKNSESDIIHYIVSRSPAFTDGDSKQFTPDTNQYVDTDVSKDKSYTYSIYATDHASNIGTAAKTNAVTPGLAKVTATPTQDTKIEYENVVVGVPAGALSSTKTLTITEVKDSDTLVAKSMGINISPVYSLGVATLNGIADPGGVQFDKPVLVGIHYVLKGEIQEHLQKNCLKAYYYNAKADNWEVMPESYVDPNTDTVYFFTKHFSLFSVQASASSSVSPEQISNMGVSPGKSYFQNNQVNISYASGSASVLAKDFFLPGRGGLDLTLSRSYDSGLGQSDWGVNEKNVFQRLFGVVGLFDSFFSIASKFVGEWLDEQNSGPASTYGFGRGWRMNFVWVEKNDNGQFIHLPGGGMKKIDWVMDGSGPSGQGHGTFECHAGDHFILEQSQTKVGDIYSQSGSSDQGDKVGENWTTSGYLLTTKEGTKYYMNGDGKLQRIVNRLGSSEINFIYNSSDKLDYILDSVGRKIVFSYDGDMIKTIIAAGKTVTYSYENDELTKVNDGGMQTTKYGYVKHSLSMSTQTISLMSIVTTICQFYNPMAWISLIVGLLPDSRSDEVYYLSNVYTPFDGEYRFTYTVFTGRRYSLDSTGTTISLLWYQFGKVTRYQEIGSAYAKDISLDYQMDYSDDKAPVIGVCNVYEGSADNYTKYTYMSFARYSNGVDEDSSYLKYQEEKDSNGKVLSAHLVDSYDTKLEAPTRVIDQTGGRNTIQEFQYDNWGNITRVTNSCTKITAIYAYANTSVSSISNTASISPPSGYGSQSIASTIHDAKIGELILNVKNGTTTPQQTWYKYESNGNLTGKAVWNNKWLETQYIYDTYGNIIKMTSPTGIETTYDYPSAYSYALMTKITLGKLTDAAGNVQYNVVLKELGYDPATFHKRWEKDARGFVTEYHYDILGRQLMTVLPDDTDTTDYKPGSLTGEPDRSGCRSDNPVQTTEYRDSDKTTTVIDPMGNRTDYVYDSFEHLMAIEKYKRTLGVYWVYSQVKVKYDNRGNISAIISPNGCADSSKQDDYTTNYYYDALGRLAKVIYPDGNYKYYDYEDLSNWVTVYDENGNRTLIKKDAVDRVTEQDYAVGAGEGYSTYFEYDALGNKISETDGRGNTTSFTYDNLNRLLTKTLPAEDSLDNPDGSATSTSPTMRCQYDDEGNLIQGTSPMGRSITHAYDEMNREIKTTTKFTALNGTTKTVVTKTFYDLAGNKIETHDPNDKIVKYSYSARGWLLTQTDPAGGVTSFTYDAVGNKLSETDVRGNVADAKANSYTAWYVYDELYRVIKAVLPDNTPPSGPDSPGDNPVISFEYDYNGNCVKETKANGQAIIYSYNGRNWLLSQTTELNSKKYTTSFEYDGVGNKRYVIDNKGNKTEYQYDALNRMVRTYLPEGNTAETFYDANGNKTATRDGRHNGSDFVYDKLNRMVQATDGEGNSTKFWYDQEGKLTKQESPTGLVTKFYLNELGMTKRTVDSLGRNRYCDYDVAGNVIYKKDPRGTECGFQYDDLYRVLQETLQNGNKVQTLSYEYDQVGNVKRASNGQVELIYNDADGSYSSEPFNRIQKVKQVMSDGTSYTTQYQYDVMGNMTGIRYPNSSDWLNYQYDKMNRLVSISGFAGTSSKPGFTYDENSALASITTNNGVTTSYQRDKDGRITNIDSTKSGNSVMSLKYTYDDANNIITRNDNSYVYDKVNRLQQATIRGYFEDNFTKADMLIGKVDQDYHGEKEQEEDVTAQTQVKMDYSARSLIFNLKMDAENICRVELSPELASHRVPTDQMDIYYRNGVGFTKLDKSLWTGTKDERGKIIIRFTPVLNTSEIKIHCNYDDLDYLQMPPDNKSEFYNSPDKLVTVYQKFISRIETYGYDGMGNRTSEKIQLRKEYGYTYTYGPKSNRLMSRVKDDGTEKIEYAYDDNGNLTSKVVTKGNTVDTWEYSYDLLNQLEQVTKNGTVVSNYVYDPSGFRVEKSDSKGRIDYVPLLNGEVGYRKEFNSGREYSFIYVGGQHLARVNGVVGGGGKKFFYANDTQGTAMGITDEKGNKVVERDFAPFGERLKQSETDVVASDEDDSAFTGKDWDEDVGLYYYNARWYDAEIGRFTSEDSVADDPNLYGYCFENPVNMIDPTGHWGLPTNAIGWASTMISAAAILSGDEKLGALAGAMGMFIAIQDSIQKSEATSNALDSSGAKQKNNQKTNSNNQTKETGLRISVTEGQANNINDLNKYVNELETKLKDPQISRADKKAIQKEIKSTKALIKTMNQLQEITDDGLKFESYSSRDQISGEKSYFMKVVIEVEAAAGTIKKVNGTTLLRNIINNTNHVATIKYEQGKHEVPFSKFKDEMIVDGQQGSGSDPVILWDPYGCGNVITQFQYTDGRIVSDNINSTFGLAHELIHAYHNMNGVNASIYKSRGIYSNGRTKVDPLEELFTIGFSGYEDMPDVLNQYESYYRITENGIRKEQGQDVDYIRIKW